MRRASVIYWLNRLDIRSKSTAGYARTLSRHSLGVWAPAAIAASPAIRLAVPTSFS